MRIGYNTEVVGVEGEEHISAVRVRGSNGEIKAEPTSGLFVFIGAKPRTDFLPSSIAKDAQGFLLTGPEAANDLGWKESRRPFSLETSLPGVFAAGDCRSRTVKRVASAIGDGAAALTGVHAFLEYMQQRRGAESLTAIFSRVCVEPCVSSATQTMALG